MSKNMKNRELTQADIESLTKIVEKYGVDGSISVYTYLLNEHGADYAGWARGVASGDAITGQGALLYMQNTAKNHLGRNLSNREVDAIRKDMALGYLNALSEKIKDTNNVYMEFDKMRDFHEKAFKASGLSLDNWTLKVPMELIGKYLGAELGLDSDVITEQWWQEISQTKGEGPYAWLKSITLAKIVKDIAEGVLYVNPYDNTYIESAEVKKSLSVNPMFRAKPIAIDKNDKILAKQWEKDTEGWFDYQYAEIIGKEWTADHWYEHDLILVNVADMSPENMLAYIDSNTLNISNTYLEYEIHRDSDFAELVKNAVSTADVKSLYINALENLDPIMVLTKTPSSTKEVTNDWIKLRTWYLMEYQYQNDQKTDFLKQIRTTFDINPNDVIQFYDDRHPKKSFSTDDSSSSSITHTVAFGKNISGDEDKDFLFITDSGASAFGFAGDDNLYAEQGNGYLIGGDGFDRYYIQTENNKIFDADGQGEVHFGDVVLGKAYRDTSVSDQKVYLQGENIKYTLNGKTLTVELINEGKTLTIEEFDKEACDLDIQLIDKAGKDIVFIIDTTGSMYDDINTVKNNVHNLISKLFANSNHDNLDTNIGIMMYSDYSLTWVTKNADTPQKAYSAINAVFEQGGGTELVSGSLKKALNEFPWRKGEEVSKQIWLFGDEPGDDLELLGEVFALSHNKKVELDGEKEGVFEYIPINTIALSDGSTASVFQSIADNTKGTYFYGRADLDTALNDIANLGTNGDDIIHGSDANNIINGGAGNDTLSGGLGSDTYIEAPNSGHDTIIETNPDGKDTNKVDFTGTSSSDYTFGRDGADLTVTGAGTSVTVSDFYDNHDGHKIDEIIFDNIVLDHAMTSFFGDYQPGKNITYTEAGEHVRKGILNAKQFIVAEDDAVVKTSATQDAVVVNGDNVQVNTGANNDKIYINGSGKIEGGLGSDEYFIGKEFGEVKIYDQTGGSDQMHFTNHNVSDLFISWQGKDLVLQSLDNADSKVIIEQQGKILHRIESIEFKDGSELTFKELESAAKIYQNYNYADVVADSSIMDNIMQQMHQQNLI